MNDLKTFTDWLFACTRYVASVVFSHWGILGGAIFAIPLIRKLAKIFSDTF